MNASPVKVALYDPSSTGGITQYTFELAQGLTAAGCPVVVVTSEDYELKHLKRDFEVWFLYGPSRVKAWAQRVRTWVRTSPRQRGEPAERSELRSDAPEAPGDGWLRSIRIALLLSTLLIRLLWRGTHIIHVHWLIDRRADVWFIHAARLLGFTIVYTVHDLLPHDEHTSENHAFFARLYKYPHRLILHSEQNRRDMLELFECAPDKLSVLPFGCINVLHEGPPESTARARERLGLAQSRRVILFFGLIKRYKGLEYLLDAFESVSARFPNASLLIAGRIADDNVETHQHYTDLLAKAVRCPNVRYDGGYIPVNRAGLYFAAADIVVLPYVSASQSGVLLSAYAAGKPVIVTESGGLAETVRDGDSGLVVAPQDSRALAAALSQLLEDAALRDHFSQRALTLAETKYSWKAIGLATSELYQSLIADRRKRRQPSAASARG